jgi:hypothetical protein
MLNKLIEIFRKKEEKTTAEIPAVYYKPYRRQGSAIFYLDNPHDIKVPIVAKNDVNFAEKSYKELLPYFLKYVLETQNDGLYEGTDKLVSENFKITEDKARNVRMEAIKSKFLVTTTKRSKFEINFGGIRTFIENFG